MNQENVKSWNSKIRHNVK